MVARCKATPCTRRFPTARSKKLPLKLSSAGQPFVSSGRCIATGRKDGKPCCRLTPHKGVPYCKDHMRSGDPSLCTAAHPLAGKILVAARDLPKGYRAALWGVLRRKKEVSQKGMEWSFEIHNRMMIDPTSCKGSLLQFCACPGPSEAAAILSTGTSTGDRRQKYGSWVFVTRETIPRNWQLTMQYGSNSKGSDTFFKERGIERVDVGSTLHPALQRKDAPAKCNDAGACTK